MVLLFGFTWLPHNVYTLIIEYDEAIFHNGESDNTYIVSMIAHLGKVRAPAKFTNAKNTIIRVAKSDTSQEKAF
ncbi:unnamed protein product [Strongylus vulgaris]|uniref:Uncharacterized protein n=1 Tax=Strongylus vulgaris TaxID=40348 RepID=A0A3P7IXL8_STRVU|nr:unnamed protein product [Strongylus vulgaris]